MNKQVYGGKIKTSDSGIDFVCMEMEEDAGDEALLSKDVRPDAARIIALGGGKGGVGRSVLAANLGVFLSVLGKKVVLLDADFGCANLHTLLGMPFPSKTLDDVIMRKRETLDDVIMPSSIPGLSLISGTGDTLGMSDPRAAQRNRFLKLVTELDVDYVILDLRAGTSKASLDLFLLADVPILVCAPEPTSMENAFRFLKAAFFRRLWHNESFKSLRGLLTDAQRSSKELGILSPPQFLELASRRFPDLKDALDAELVAYRPKIVMNFVRTRTEGQLGEAIAVAIRQKMNTAVEFLGSVEYDEAVHLSIRKRRPLLFEFPEVKPSKNIELVARRIVSLDTGALSRNPNTTLFKKPDEQTHYEILEVDPGASDEEVRKSHRRLRDIYSSDSVVVYGLFNTDDLNHMVERIESAYAVVIDPQKRREYDLTLRPLKGYKPNDDGDHANSGAHGASDAAAHPERKEGNPSKKEPIHDGTPFPDDLQIDESTVFTGELLRKIREHRSIDLRDLSSRTKISLMTLKALEEMRYDEMLAPVYVRGFLMEYAKYLHLPINQVSSSYLSLYNRYLQIKSENQK